MNIKRVFGALLTLLGIAGLIWGAILFVYPSAQREVKSLIILGLLGFIFFITGISLVRTTKDEA